MDTSVLATSFSVDLPAWVPDELADWPESLPTLDDRMRLVNRLASRNPAEGNGGPFAAIVTERESGRIVSVGVNVVLASGLSSAHAEVVALSLAQTRLGSWDLGAADRPALDLINNWRPCLQCLGSTMWSGVQRLVVAGSGPECEDLTRFDEGPVRDDWAEQFEARGIEVVDGVRRAEAVEVFAEYGRRVGAGAATVYNARGTGPR
ncbi:nucleoside deaminase [Frondihabitans australicus]|uniref:tRNA(Arg) A34 adenosine deaminase TadA n=1 Tax=Frondihabitans australicus TaxID=386892 RepID=A0A495IJK9_9MICO|nr:nucleoside deaminase [Frondihabitans australicus]RKR75969.1 tRNA(Arg) A34 adenosine deaminase TadA [Frondihabitans australicus]